MHYSKLHLSSLTPEMHGRTCGYWYTVTSRGSTPHTAFRTREALFRWMERRGLTLTQELPAQGEYGAQWLAGEYAERMHGSADDIPGNWIVAPFLKLSNGQYTSAVVNLENGIRTVHFLGPNAARPIFDYTLARAHEDAGLTGLPRATVEA